MLIQAMKSFNINSYYDQINKNILLAQSYSEHNELAWIIKSSRLKPEEYLKNKFTLCKKWVDEYGNSLSIIKNKKLQIIINDISANKTLTTDLYYGLQIEKIAKISNFVYICYGLDDENNKMYFLYFHGIDNYARCFMNIDGDWVKVSPLTIGIQHLKNIFKNKDIRFFKEFSNKEKMPFPCVQGKAWLSFIPVSAVFYREMEKEHDVLLPFLNYKKGK